MTTQQTETTALAIKQEFDKATNTSLVDQGKNLPAIKTPEAYTDAVDLRAKLVDQRNEIETTRKNLKEPVLEAGRRIDKQAKTAAQPINAAIAKIDSCLSTYRRIEQEKARKKQERLEAKRAAQQAEREEQDHFAAVDPLPPAPVVAPRIPKVEGFTTVELHRARVTSKAKLVLAAALGVLENSMNGVNRECVVSSRAITALKELGIDSAAPLECLDENHSALNRLATAFKQDLRISGVEYYVEESQRHRV